MTIKNEEEKYIRAKTYSFMSRKIQNFKFTKINLIEVNKFTQQNAKLKIIQKCFKLNLDKKNLSFEKDFRKYIQKV